MSSPAHASAPASAANLGPGFDVLALALELRCRVSAERADHWSVHHVGSFRPDVDADDAVLAAARAAVGERRALKLTVDNDIPVSRGLGSSSAATAAGALAAWRAVGEEHPPETLFELVAAFDGHPDNAAAAVHGGLVLASAHGQVHRLPWRPDLACVIAVPDVPFPTLDARRLLPSAYPVDVVVRTVARTAALIGGLMTGDATLFEAARGDEIHEEHRNLERPDVASLVACAYAAGAVHACWSGAGPSMLSLVPVDRRERVARALADALGDGGTVLQPAVATTGAV